MIDRHQLLGFQLTRNPNTNDLLLLVKGDVAYKSILNRAFPHLYMSRLFSDRFGRFDWGTYIQGADATQELALGAICSLLQQLVFINDDLDECFALSYHTQISPAGGYCRTAVGQLVREAKPYDRGGSSGSREKARELARLLAEFIRQHPTYHQAEVLLAVPPSNPNKVFDLPTLLVQEIAAITGQSIATPYLRKTRMTRAMKDCRTIQEKIDNLRGAFLVADPAPFIGRKLLLVDDIYQTGFSINEVGSVLRQAGASLILGLVATKTSQDLPDTLPSKEEDDDLPF
jgi:hypothetical protein